MMSKYLLVVGSGSEIKLTAVKKGFEKYKCFEIESESRSKSEISEQPIGRDEIIRGAINRARSAMKFRSDAFVCIGIENGLIYEHDKWNDIACIVVITHNSVIAETWTDMLYVPNQYVYNPDVLIGPKPLWSNLKDPHLVLSGKSRIDFIAQTISEQIAPILNIYARDICSNFY